MDTVVESKATPQIVNAPLWQWWQLGLECPLPLIAWPMTLSAMSERTPARDISERLVLKASMTGTRT
jgi:hypothetical protein